MSQTFHDRKHERRKAFFAYRYGWKQRACGACAGSGRYDSNGSPRCGACDGTGRETYRGPKAIDIQYDGIHEAIEEVICRCLSWHLSLKGNARTADEADRQLRYAIQLSRQFPYVLMAKYLRWWDCGNNMPQGEYWERRFQELLLQRDRWIEKAEWDRLAKELIEKAAGAKHEP